MALKVLIIDDDADVAESMAEVCRAMQLEPTVCTVPAEAETTFSAVRPALVVIDLFLPGTDGLTLGRQLRTLEGGAQVPMLAVSGVMKQQSVIKDCWSQLQADFLAKPFRASELQEKIATRLGLARPEKPQPRRKIAKKAVPPPKDEAFQSELAQDPPYRIFTRLYHQRARGHLDLTRGQARRRITFHFGQIRHAASNLSKENVGGMQVAQGVLEEPVFRKAVALAQEKKLPLTEALVKTKAMERRQIEQALGEQVAEVSAACMGWADGTAVYRPDPGGAEATPDNRIHPLVAVIKGIKRFYTPAACRQFLESKKAAYLHRTDTLSREEYTLRSSNPSERVLRLIDGKKRIADLLDATPEADLPLLFAIVATGLGTLAREPQPDEPDPAPEAPEAPEPVDGEPAVVSPTAPAPGVPSAPPPVVASAPVQTDAQLDASQEFSPDDIAARDRIATEHARIQDANHYEVFGVPNNASEETIKSTFLELAKQWHTDSFAGLNLGSAAPKLEEIFTRINEVKGVLLSDTERSNYDVLIDRKAKGQQTDIGLILEASDLIVKSAHVLKSGKAKKALEMAQRAIELDDTQAEAFAIRGMARYRVEGAQALEGARADIRKALNEQVNFADGHYYLGAIELTEGNPEGAETFFKAAMEINPNHPETLQQVRLLRMRQERKK